MCDPVLYRLLGTVILIPATVATITLMAIVALSAIKPRASDDR